MMEPQNGRSLGPDISAQKTAAQNSEIPILGFIIPMQLTYCVFFLIATSITLTTWQHKLAFWSSQLH